MASAAQFVIDADGNKTAVILSIEEYEEILEDLHLGRLARDSKTESQRPFLDVVEEMRLAGEIDV